MKYHDILSLVTYPPAFDILFVLIFAFFSPIGLGSLSILQTIAVSLVFIIIIPLFPVPIFLKKGIVDFYVSEKKQRPIFYLIAIGSYAVAGAYFLIFDSVMMFTLVVSFGVIATVFVIINHFWKISVHAAGVAGPLTALAYVFHPGLLLLHFFTLLVMWSRVRLGAHTTGQVIAGAALSAIVTFLVFYAFYPVRPF